MTHVTVVQGRSTKSVMDNKTKKHDELKAHRVFLVYNRYMKSLDKTSKKNFPWIILLATITAIGLVMLFQDPLSYLRDLLARDNFLISGIVYTVVLAVSVVVSRFSIAPAVPFVAKILSPEVTFVLTIVGWTIGSSGAFFIARYGKESMIEYVYPVKTVTQNQYRLHVSPTRITLLQTRLFAALDNFSYFVGLRTNIRFMRFLLVTLLGSVPAAFIFSFSADAIADGEKSTLFGLFFATALIGLSYVSHKGWTLFERPAHIYTNAASFTAGEVMSVAALVLFFEKRNKPYKLHRSSDLEQVIKKRAKSRRKQELYICDKNQISDEQHNIFGSVDAGLRGNNIPYGVFGLVWRKYGAAICGSEIVSNQVMQDLVLGVDAEDAGIRHEEVSTLYIDQWSLSEIIEKTYQYNGSSKREKDAQRQSFMSAVVFAQDFLRRVVDKQNIIHQESEVKER